MHGRESARQDAKSLNGISIARSMSMTTRMGVLALGIVATVVDAGRARADELTLMSAGGLAVPACTGMGSTCAGSLGLGPSLEIMLATRINPVLSWGFGARGTRQHWQVTFPSMIQGAPPGTVDTTLTTLFLGGGVRLTPLPDAALRPIATALAGLAMQHESGLALCGTWTPPLPTVVLGVGAAKPVSPSVGLFLMGVVSTGLAPGHCELSDGPPGTPFAMWGLGLNAGIELGFHDTPYKPRQ
jgi:hypothetical protein